MERDPKSPRPPRGARRAVETIMPPPIEDGDDEITAPGVFIDPELQAALHALQQEQQVAQTNASNIETLLVKKRTPRP